MKKEVAISRVKIIGYIVSAVIGTFIATLFSIAAMFNSDHFKIIDVDNRVIALEEIVVPREVWEQQNNLVLGKLDAIETYAKDNREDIKELVRAINNERASRQ